MYAFMYMYRYAYMHSNIYIYELYPLLALNNQNTSKSMYSLHSCLGSPVHVCCRKDPSDVYTQYIDTTYIYGVNKELHKRNLIHSMPKLLVT